VAKGNTNAGLGDRASAAFSAAGDKIDESQQCVLLPSSSSALSSSWRFALTLSSLLQLGEG